MDEHRACWLHPPMAPALTLSRFHPPRDDWRRAHRLGAVLSEWERAYERIYVHSTPRERARMHGA